MIIQLLAWCDRNRPVLLLLLAIALMAGALASCGGEVAQRPLPPGPDADSAGATLGAVGRAVTWAGGIAAAVGVALALVAVFVPQLGPLAGLFRFAGVAGIGATATGASILWLADRPWVMVLGCAAGLGLVVWWYWPGIRRALDRRLGRQEGLTP